MFGALIGGLLGGVGGALDKGGKELHSTVDPLQKKFLEDKFNKAQGLYDQYSGLSGGEKGIQQGGRDWYAQQGQQLSGAAQGAAMSNLQGFENARDLGQNFRARKSKMDMGAVRAQMDDAGMQQQMDAIGADVRAQLGGDLSGVDAGAAGRGMIGSSKQGIAAGVAQGAAARSIASQSAQMRGQAFQSALGREGQAAGTFAQQQNQAGQNRINQEMSLGQQGMAGLQQAYGMGQGQIQGALDLEGLDRRTAYGAMDMYNTSIGAPIHGELHDKEPGMASKVLGGVSGGMSAFGGI